MLGRYRTQIRRKSHAVARERPEIGNGRNGAGANGLFVGPFKPLRNSPVNDEEWDRQPITIRQHRSESKVRQVQSPAATNAAQ